MPIKRDEFDIVCQHSSNDFSYMDGGDSARTEGLLSLMGSKKDSDILLNFIKPNGDCVRHPFQSKNNNNNPNNFTRDQLLCLMAGLSVTSNGVLFAKHIFKAYAKRFFRGQNTHDQQNNLKPWYRGRDILHPGHIGFMIKSAKMYNLYMFLPLCWLFLLFEILFHTLFTPSREPNQLLSMLIVSGKPFLKLYCFLNPSWKDSILVYWGSWRDQNEIGYMLINHIQKELNNGN